MIDKFRGKSIVNVYDAYPRILAKTIDKYVLDNNKSNIKNRAYEIGIENFSVDNLKQKYLNIINE
jgi:hypothetical protein